MDDNNKNKKEKVDTASPVTLPEPFGGENDGVPDHLSSKAPARAEQDFVSQFLVDGGGWNLDGDDLMVEVIGDQIFIGGIGIYGSDLGGDRVINAVEGVSAGDMVHGGDGVINAVGGVTAKDMLHGDDRSINGVGSVSARDMVHGRDGSINGVGSVSAGDMVHGGVKSINGVVSVSGGDMVHGCDGSINGVGCASAGDMVHGGDRTINRVGSVSVGDMVRGGGGTTNGSRSVSAGNKAQAGARLINRVRSVSVGNMVQGCDGTVNGVSASAGVMIHGCDGSTKGVGSVSAADMVHVFDASINRLESILAGDAVHVCDGSKNGVRSLSAKDMFYDCDGINGVQSVSAKIHGCDGSINEVRSLSAEDIVHGCEGSICGVGDQKVSVAILANSNDGEVRGVEEPVDDVEQLGLLGGQQTVTVEPVENAEPVVQNTRFVSVKPRSSEKIFQAIYLLPLRGEHEFSVSDLVWGKVKRHLWWPGKIFHPSQASERAMKDHKKNCFLVAYYGNKTFKWKDASVLKPFQINFALAEKQRNSGSFQNAVTCALEEVSRRVELGLSCSCVPSDDYENIRYQNVENAGIQDKSISRDDANNSFCADSFNPRNLLGYLKGLARLPFGGANRLELMIAKAQLLSFYRLNGYRQLPEFQSCEGLPETEEDFTNSSYYRWKRNLKGTGYIRRKKSIISDLMSRTNESAEDYFSCDGKISGKEVLVRSARKRKDTESLAGCTNETQTVYIAEVFPTRPINQSSGIGDRIQRVATQLTGSSIAEYGGNLSPSNLLSQLHLAAKISSEKPPSDAVITFFLDVRRVVTQLTESSIANSVISEQPSAVGIAVGEKKISSLVSGDPDTFEFKDTSDSGRADMFIDNDPKEQLSQTRSRQDSRSVSVDVGESQTNHRPHARKRHSDGNNNVAKKKTTQKSVEKKPDLSPTELVLSFPESEPIPSETNLNRMFSKYGSLWESETAVDEDNNRARVIFKKRSDAEVAQCSSRIFNIFGSTVVSYELNYTPNVPFKATDDPRDTFIDFQFTSHSMFGSSSAAGGM